MFFLGLCSSSVAARRVRQDTSHPAGDGGVFGALVRGVSGEGEGRECTTCHRVTPMKKMLLNNPDLGQWTETVTHAQYTLYTCTCMYIPHRCAAKVYSCSPEPRN